MKKYSLFLASVLVSLSLANCGNAPKAQVEEAQADSTSVKTDSISQPDTTEVVEETAVKEEVVETPVEKEVVEEAPTSGPNDVFNAYSSKLRSYRGGEYFLLDLTGNGTPEIFIVSGTCEADYEMDIFTYENGALKKLGNRGVGHMGFYKGSNYYIEYWGHQGCYAIVKVTYQNGRLVDTLLDEGETEEDYPSVSESPINLISASNTAPIRKALGI